MPDGSGVRFALDTSPHGPSNLDPPANSRPAIGCPLTLGVWQSVQPANFTIYAPRCAWSENAGVITGAVSGLGTSLIIRFAGNAISVFGNLFLTAGIERTYTITEAKSSSDRFRKPW